MSATGPDKISPGQNLLIDADDTLWENNIYFERAITDFISFLNHHRYTPDEVRHVLYDVERENIRQHGYGMQSFANALVVCFEKLSVEPVTADLHETIRGIAYQIAEHPMEFLPEVPETLADLSQRHRLFMVTKGNITEQLGKVERSGLSSPWRKWRVFCKADDVAGCAIPRSTWQRTRRFGFCKADSGLSDPGRVNKRTTKACQSGFSALAACPHPATGAGPGSG